MERTMSHQNYTTAFLVDQTPEEVFSAINNVRGWWTGEIEGSANKLGDEFTYRYEDFHFSKQKVTEFVPGKKVGWRVVDASLNYVEDKTEWTDTEITFEIARIGDQTEVRFTHLGLVPDFECFDSCSNSWGFYTRTSLYNLITTGKDQDIPQIGDLQNA
jgi:regulatory protein YycH of two-component signal transduction system YycFG